MSNQYQYHQKVKKVMISNDMGFTRISEPFAKARLANVRKKMQNLVAAITRIRHQNKKDNTSFACDPKVAEYYAFCPHHFSGIHESLRYTVIAEKLYELLLYHSMHNKYKLGGKR
jgi:hypothetical protein